MRPAGWQSSRESAATAFYLLKLEGIRIGDSAPAPLLTLIVGPSEEGREVGEAKKERAERYAIRRRFWTDLLERAKQRSKLHGAVSAGESGWVGAGSGKRGASFNYVITQHGTSVELYIDRGRDAEDENKVIFDSLYHHKDEIEQAFGERLSWEPLEAKRACRIAHRMDVGGYRDESRWPEIQEAMVDGMVRLEQALRPYFAQLPV